MPLITAASYGEMRKKRVAEQMKEIPGYGSRSMQMNRIGLATEPLNVVV
jgi:hypothetical protein